MAKILMRLLILTLCLTILTVSQTVKEKTSTTGRPVVTDKSETKSPETKTKTTNAPDKTTDSMDGTRSRDKDSDDEDCYWHWDRSYVDADFRYQGKCVINETRNAVRYTGLFIRLTSINDGTTSLDIDNSNWLDAEEATEEYGVNANKNLLTVQDTDDTDTPSMEWKLVIFDDDGDATINDKQASVKKDSIKFAIQISDWAFTDETASISVCFDLIAYSCTMEDKQGECITKYNIEDKLNIEVGEYVFSNEETAECTDNDDIDVEITATVEDTGYERVEDQVRICYSFGYCESGDYYYDPFVYYEGDEETNIGYHLSFNFIVLLYISCISCIHLV